MLLPTTLVSSLVQIVTIYQMSVMCMQVGSDGLIEPVVSVLKQCCNS